MTISVLAMAAFLVTVVLVLWRPGGVHEAIPALIGAFLLFLVGLIDRQDVWQVMAVAGNSSVTIISTFVMAMVLEGSGFFQWVGDLLIRRAADSGRRLFHLVLAFSACLTLFLNNDGSILLGTPIMIALVRQLGLSKQRAFPYLIGACLMASVASPPIGVSNMANLEAMSLVGVTLTEHLRYVLLPALAGFAVCWGLLFAVLRRHLPPSLAAGRETTSLPQTPPPPGPPPRVPAHPPHAHAPVRALPPPPHAHRPPAPPNPQWPKRQAPPPAPPQSQAFMWFALAVVILVRFGFFAASVFQVPTSLVALGGAAILLIANLHAEVMQTKKALLQAPWPILGFAFGMDLVVFGLRNGGIIGLLAGWLGPHVHASMLGASLLPGGVTAVIASLLNNHPGLIIGSLTLRAITGLPEFTRLVAYASIVLASDLGALLLPIGTLAGLIWFHLVHQHGYRYTWWEYTKVTLAVVPASFLLSLGVLYGLAELVRAMT